MRSLSIESIWLLLPSFYSVLELGQTFPTFPSHFPLLVNQMTLKRRRIEMATTQRGGSFKQQLQRESTRTKFCTFCKKEIITWRMNLKYIITKLFVKINILCNITYVLEIVVKTPGIIIFFRWQMSYYVFRVLRQFSISRIINNASLHKIITKLAIKWM